MWYIFIFLSVLFVSGANIFDKILSGQINREKVVMTRYFWAVSILIIFLIFTTSLPTFWIPGILLMCLGVMNYLILLAMYRGLEHTHTGLFFVVGYLYIPFLYYINIALFWESEVLDIYKFIIWILFLMTVSFLVYITGKKMQIVSLWSYFYALLCAIGWMLSIGWSAYVVKHAIIPPLHIFFYEALGSLMFATIVYTFRRKESLSFAFITSWQPLMWGIFLALGLWLLLESYRYLPANVVNILSLSDLIVTTIFSYLILHEKLEKKIILIIWLAFILLISFAFV